MGLYNTFTVKASKIMLNFVYEGFMGPSTVTTDPVTGNPYLLQEVGAALPKAIPALPGIVCGVHKGTEQLQGGSPQEQMEKD